MTDNLEDILNEIARNKDKWDTDTENPADKAKEERRDKVASFQLNMNLDEEYGTYTPPEPPKAESAETFGHTREVATPRTDQSEILESTGKSDRVVQEPRRETFRTEPPTEKTRVAVEEKRTANGRKAHEVWGCAGSIFYVVLILGLSLVLACFIIVAVLDVTGLNKSTEQIKVTVEADTDEGEVADLLLDSGVIDHKWIFSLYSKVRHGKSNFKPGVYTLSASMGYGNIVEELRAGVPRTTVRLTIPEGFTVDAIAALMEENAVCTKKDFYNAVQTGDYSSYSFVAEIPANEGDYAGRGYALEGYLFPDTYDFYTGSTGEAVVKKLLDNFDNRINTTYRAKMATQGMTVNDVVILASIVQAEASDGEWSRVARVLENRLDNPAEYPRLQCDATIGYYNNLDRTVEGLTIAQNAYDTAVKTRLPAGAVCNPGLNAIDAVLSPSDSSDVRGCYYFANDPATGQTYYSKTYAQHQAVCKKYGIGEKGTVISSGMTADESL